MSITTDKTKIKTGAVNTLEWAGNDLGPTDEAGVTIKKTDTRSKWSTDQSAIPVIDSLDNREVSVEFNLAHTHLENVHRALATGDTACSGSCLSINTTEASLKSLKVIGPFAAPSGNRTYMFHSCRMKGDFSIKHTRKVPPALLPCVVDCLEDTDYSETGYILDAAA